MESVKTTFVEKLVKGLRTTATELEEFRVQAALGKAEAKDAFQQTKKRFNEFIHEVDIKLDHAADVTHDKSIELKAALEHLRVQLALGTAEARESLEEQMKKISNALNKL